MADDFVSVFAYGLVVNTNYSSFLKQGFRKWKVRWHLQAWKSSRTPCAAEVSGPSIPTPSVPRYSNIIHFLIRS